MTLLAGALRRSVISSPMSRAPVFFRIRAVKSDRGLETIDYEKYRRISFRRLKRMIRTAARNQEDLDLWLEQLPMPNVRLRGTSNCWPAVIPPFGCGAPIVIREDLMHNLEASNLTGMRFQQVKLRGFAPGKLLWQRRPHYYALLPAGNMDFSVRVYDESETSRRFLLEVEDRSDPRYKELLSARANGTLSLRFLPRVETWNGSDVFTLNNYDHMFGEFYATLEFVQHIRNTKWAGFTAHPLDALGDSFIDLHERSWPPSSWYPRSQPDD